MNNGGDAAEQVIRMSLEGFEFAARLSGAGAKNIAVLIYSILKQERRSKGKARLTSMLRSGKELKVFTLRNEDLKKFTQEAKKYGVLYCVLTDRKNKDPHAAADIIARAEDASKISRIVERFDLAAVDTSLIMPETENASQMPPVVSEIAKETAERGENVMNAAEKEQLLGALLGEQEGEQAKDANPPIAKTEKSPLSEPSLKQPENTAKGTTMMKDKPSVREELRVIKEKQEKTRKDLSGISENSLSKGKEARQKSQTKHKQPNRRKQKRSKGAR